MIGSNLIAYYYFAKLLDFLADLTRSLAWPLALVLFLPGFLDKLIPFIEMLKFRDFELKFRERLKTAEAQAENFPAPLDGQAADPAQALAKNELLKLADENPALAVLGAWVDVEKTLRQALQRQKIQSKRPSLKLFEELLKKVGVEARSKAALFENLHGLRNLAAHGHESPGLGKGGAKAYIELCFRMAVFIDGL